MPRSTECTRQGAAVVFQLVNFCGDRMGRVRDPFGHLWLLTQRMEALGRKRSSGAGMPGRNNATPRRHPRP